MTCTALDDGWLRTHDEAAQLLRYATIGATVLIERLPREHTPDLRQYTIVLDGAAEYAVSAADAYALPCLAAPLARRARDLCDSAVAALAAHRRRA